MEFIRDQKLESELLKRVSNKYIKDRPGLPHLSELYRCLTFSYYERNDPLEWAKLQILYFGIGFALEKVFLSNGDNEEITTQLLDRVYMTPDYISLEGVGVDLKSTRMGTSESGVTKIKGKEEWPENWLIQFMAYCRLLNDETWNLYDEPVGGYHFGVAILHIGRPVDLVGGRFIFTRKELEDNWAWVQERRSIFMDHMRNEVVPMAFKFNKGESPSSPECTNYGTGTCKYLDRCQMSGWEQTLEAGAGHDDTV